MSRSAFASIARLLFLAAVWGASFLFMRIGIPELGAFPLVLIRVGSAALFLLPFLAFRSQLGSLKSKPGALLLVGLVNTALPFTLFAYAARSLEAGTSAIINSTAPLWGALLSFLFLKERLGKVRLAGLVLGFSGVALLVSERSGNASHMGQSANLLPILAGLSATFCYGVGALLTKKLLAGMPPLSISTGSLLGATLFALPTAVPSWPTSPISHPAWASALALGILCTGVAYIFYFRMMEEGGPTRALAVTYLIPVFGLFWGWLFLGEKVTPTMGLACAVVLSGTILSTQKQPTSQVARQGRIA